MFSVTEQIVVYSVQVFCFYIGSEGLFLLPSSHNLLTQESAMGLYQIPSFNKNTQRKTKIEEIVSITYYYFANLRKLDFT